MLKLTSCSPTRRRVQSRFSVRIPPPPNTTLFPYTTLFRSSPNCTPTTKEDQEKNVLETCFAGWPRRSTGEARFEHVDRKSTRLNSSHTVISYAVFCLKEKISRSRVI